MAERPEKAIPVTSEERKNCFRRSDPKGKKDPSDSHSHMITAINIRLPNKCILVENISCERKLRYNYIHSAHAKYLKNNARTRF